MEFTAEEIQEFKNEAHELLDEAENNLLSLEKGGDFVKTYAAVFRVFHSLKGGSGMLGMNDLQAHMHQLENHYQECKHLTTLPSPIASYFLSGIDASRQIMGGKKPAFDYSLFNITPPNVTKTKQEPEPEKTSTTSEKIATQAFKAEETKILVIDDEPEIVEILMDLLKESGFEVAGHTSPKEALENISIFKPDVVLSDYKMPDFTGFEVLQEINKIDPDLPVIFISGHLSKEIILEALAYGIYDAIEKPCKPGEVVTKCKNAAERFKITKLLSNAISFIYYQYSDLDKFLQSQGAKEVREQMHEQFKTLLNAKRKLKFLKRTVTQNS